MKTNVPSILEVLCTSIFGDNSSLITYPPHKPPPPAAHWEPYDQLIAFSLGYTSSCGLREGFLKVATIPSSHGKESQQKYLAFWSHLHTPCTVCFVVGTGQLCHQHGLRMRQTKNWDGDFCKLQLVSSIWTFPVSHPPSTPDVFQVSTSHRGFQLIYLGPKTWTLEVSFGLGDSSDTTLSPPLVWMESWVDDEPKHQNLEIKNGNLSAQRKLFISESHRWDGNHQSSHPHGNGVCKIHYLLRGCCWVFRHGMFEKSWKDRKRSERRSNFC